MAIVLSGVFGMSAAQAAYQDRSSNADNFEISGFGGGKIMDKDDWSPAQNEYEFGGELYYKPTSWIVGLTAGYFYGHGSGDISIVEYDEFGDPIPVTTSFTSTTREIQLGLKKYWSAGRVGRAFASGGVTFGYAKAELLGDSFSDNGLGGWVGGGFMFNVARHFSIGPKVEYSYYKTTIAGYDAKSGGLHFGALFTYGW